MYDLSNLPGQVSPLAERSWKKDNNAFVQREEPCYWANGVSYTRADFVSTANGEVSIAEQLFSSISGQTPQKALHKLVNEGVLCVPDYMTDEERTILSFYEPPLPTGVHQQLLEAQEWEPLFPELPYPRLWTQQAPDVPVPQGIAFVDLIKRSEPETGEPSNLLSFEEGNSHE